MNCIVCGRTLKNPTINGAGKICSRKLRSLSGAGRAKTRVELIYNQTSDGVAMRRYMVFTDPRSVVVVWFAFQTGERFAECRNALCSGRCVHIDAIVEVDDLKFPIIKKDGSN